MPPPPPSNRRDFEIVIICALSLEAQAVGALFDHTWEDEDLPFAKREGDPNKYHFGRIGVHDVVLFISGMGKINAASAASSCRSSFPKIRLALVVGICGGIPIPKSGKEIWLGDVLISEGIFQYDFGRQLPGQFRRKASNQDALPRPNQEIRSYLASLTAQTGSVRLADRTSLHLEQLLLSKLEAKYSYPGAENDKLFEATYRHKHHDSSCEICAKCKGRLDEVCEDSLKLMCDDLQCNDNRLVRRNRLADASNEAAQTSNKNGIRTELTDVPKPEVHFGYIASGDKVMKSAEDRDELAANEEENVIGFEMEGAGVWDVFPCVVIKAVCDYADSHKNKRWQNYAAAVAAACSKAFLQDWAVTEKSTPRLSSGEISRAGGNPINVQLPFSGSAGIHVVLAGGDDLSYLQTLDSPTEMVTSVAFSPDKQQLASVSSDGTLRFWDAGTGKLQWAREHSGYRNSIAFSRNGRWLASAHSDYTLGFWDIEKRTLKATPKIHSNIVNSVVFSPTGQLLASASEDWTICVWNTGTATLQRVFGGRGGHTAGVTSVAFSPKLKEPRLASASKDRTVRIWAVNGSLLRIIPSGPTEVNSLAFSSDGRLLATASRGRTVRIWHATTGALQTEFKCHSSGIRSETLSYNGQPSSHTNSFRVRAATIGTPSALLSSGLSRSDYRGASSQQDQVALPHRPAPELRAPRPQRPETRTPTKPDRLEPDFRHPIGNRGTLPKHESAPPVAIGTVFQEPHRRGPQGGSYRKTYGWGKSLDSQNPSSASIFSREDSNGRARGSYFAPPGTRTPREKSDGDIEIHKLSFSDDGKYLITDIGVMKLEYPTSGAVPTVSWLSYVLDIEGSWITYRGENVLFLPPEYRPVCQDFRDGAIALGSSSGRVTILRVD